ncbi:III subunit RPC3 [Seminavis robusta]|uniref:DNA-directed RNA polymerase III subunit RPC3 n=1 Tax=Seminavis robusta TaxID=568900 RepID=A0A9N8H634_9STRA|nr:III subunit RPC3 [Seminavis robusta]|eukprot:Sro35_g022610.1 III subunit RPC3 (608) ;mRNA; r:140046-141971
MSMSSSIPFASFNQTSELTSVPHDPMLSLASNCIRDYFGPTVQLVADGLVFRGEPLTLQQLVQCLRTKCRQKVYSQERIRLLGPKVASRLQNQSLQLPPIKAALLVLIQHSIVTVTVKKVKGKLQYQYTYDRTRARLLPRYPRYVEYAKRALDDNAVALVEELLVQGRLRTVDAVSKTVERLEQAAAANEEAANEGEDDDENKPDDSKKKEDNTALKQTVLESFKKLAQAGFLEEVPKMKNESENADPDAGETEFEAKEPPKKKQKTGNDAADDNVKLQEEEDPEIVSLLKGSAYKRFLTRHTVWRVNIAMFHESLRSFILGRLVAERYGHKVQSAGSMVTAALKYLAHRRHAEKSTDTEMTFDAASIQRYLPKPVQELLEKKRQAAVANNTSRNMAVVSQVARALQQLASYKSPICVLEVETGAKPEDSRFEICTTRMVQYLQQRITNQMILDHHGEVGARIVTVLSRNGYLESDSLAEVSMVPAKDCREILHRLYRSKYIDLFTLSQSRQHNPSNMIYLWTVNGQRILKNATDNVCTALLNLRLRRQHEVEVGKNWIERAQEAGDMDENDHEADKQNHKKFCLGLERLYGSCLQLDETLMIMEDM